MATDRPGNDDIDVRLEWPSGPERTMPAAREAADEQAPPVRPAPPRPDAPEPLTVTDVRPPSVLAPTASTVMVEAYDRLANRVLERLRSLREDVDADLAALRSELASLRHAVDDVGDRVQLRTLRATIDELRGDVSGLRRAVLEWPELEQVSADVAGLRADMSDLLSRDGGAGGDVGEIQAELTAIREELAELREQSEAGPPAVADEGAVAGELAAIRVELGSLRSRLAEPASVAGLAPITEEVAALRDEVVALRRRIALRAGSSGVDDDQIERLAAAISERLDGRPAPGRGR